MTSSPSMDILISSNLERLIYKLVGEDSSVNQELMKQLSQEGVYSLKEEMKDQLQDFYGNYATEEETAQVIHTVYEDSGYVLDTHTAVAAAVYEKYKEDSKDETKTLIASTASPYKFTRSVMEAIDGDKYQGMGDFELVDELCRISNVPVPKAIEEIRSAQVLHTQVCAKDKMKEMVREILTK